MNIDKSLLTNLLAIFLIAIGTLPFANSAIIFTIGIFALSGSFTNWLAVHMLFEKIPFIYGSGVIPNRFADFKNGIKTLIVEEFFNQKNISKFLDEQNSAEKINSKINFDKVFNDLMEAIASSSLGGMLQMIGGTEALQPLKEPIITKLKEVIADLTQEGGNLGSDLTAKIEEIIDKRLEELTPEKVKEIIQKMIRKHLGWLVVWGGVFGGLIGLIFALL
jgi:uncharacterized membrane protein YheB (UPF0754 family)